MLDEGYLGYISKDPALISDKKFEHPKDVTFDGKIVILKSSTLEELLNPGVLVFASVSVDNEKYVIPDNDLSSEIMKIIQKSGCYVENHSFRLSRGETY
ncbi:hypothetical protein MACH26_01630 [Planctobacterium marinum]|uniref:Uncharacterized protein n=2 Tax=Planctobacterium marinum TaxID=1631968 RepID=A0AA48HJB4_9ALTE|nr:hypothetical protein MACH26_01630 [Planctobacterium marinum]